MILQESIFKIKLNKIVTLLQKKTKTLHLSLQKMKVAHFVANMLQYDL